MVQTFVYKTIDHCEISLDVHSDPHTHNQPILLWFHGGELLQGSRRDVPPHILRGVERREYVLVSADYRLAPQSSIEDILEDALDALRFVRRQLSFRLTTSTIHSSDIAVGGCSGGAYLALLVALRDRKLRCCITTGPISDPTAHFFSTPHQAKSYDSEFLAPLLDESAPVTSSPAASPNRDDLTSYMLETASLDRLIGLTKCQNGDSTRFVVAEEIMQREEEMQICPMYIVHGRADKIVDISQSQAVANALEDCGAEFVFEEIPDGSHLFENDEACSLREMHDFLHSHWCHPPPDHDASFTDTNESRNLTSSTFTGSRTPSPAPSIDSGSTRSADEDYTSSTYSDDSDDAEQQWAAQIHEMTLILNLIFLPLAGKYFGRQFAFWGWGKFMSWRNSYQLVTNKGMQRLNSAVLAGLS